jgi:hypothetical protein
MKTVYIYSCPFVLCPNDPSQRIYIVSRIPLDAGDEETCGYELDACVDVDDDEEFDCYKYNGSSKFYVFEDTFVKILYSLSQYQIYDRLDRLYEQGRL